MLVFCDKCDNLMYPFRENGGVNYKCRCGEVKKGREEEEEEEKKEEDYQFTNKILSREYIKKYLIRSTRWLKPFNQQKVLILTHIRGDDFRQILHPLGYRNNNIYIIERDKEVFQKMKENPLFDGCHLYNMDLVDFKMRKKFDLLYLDFKSNICYVKGIWKNILKNACIR